MRKQCNHAHAHTHHHAQGNLRKKIILLTITGFLLTGAVIIEKVYKVSTLQALLIYLVPYLLIGYSTLKKAATSIVQGNYFNEHLLMSLATVGALYIGFLPEAEAEFKEAVLVMLLFQLGELFEGYAENKSQDSISHLIKIHPDTANVERKGEIMVIPPNEVATGEIIIIKPGEKIPLDGIILKGNTSVNTIAVTGESMPRTLQAGDEVLSGCINLTGVIHVRTTRSFADSTVSRIINLITDANSKKSKSESFITRFAQVYTPIVVITALLLAVIPPLFQSGNFMTTFPEWLHRALIFLIVSCPCALVLSVPLTFFGGLGRASREGILIKGSSYIDTLTQVKTIVFDKTGTLTHGRFTIKSVHPKDFNKQELLYLTAQVESFSTHPIGKIFQPISTHKKNSNSRITGVEEFAGLGIKARINGQSIYVGNQRFMKEIGIEWVNCHSIGTIIHVAIDRRYIGHIVISDSIKKNSLKTISTLREKGINKIVMLSGDRKEVAIDVAQKLNIDSCYAELLPDDKVKYIEQLLTKQKIGEKLAFVGDGINDAPVLKRADIGIAMGGLGSDAAIEAADVVLMDDNLSKITTAINISRYTMHIAHENICLVIGTKIIVLVLSAIGFGTMWMAVFADVGITILAVFNAMRTLSYRLPE